MGKYVIKLAVCMRVRAFVMADLVGLEASKLVSVNIEANFVIELPHFPSRLTIFIN